jgi:hypothetical protein
MILLPSPFPISHRLLLLLSSPLLSLAMSAIDFPPATVESAMVLPSIASNRHQHQGARAAVTGKIVSITLEPNTIAFVFGVFI